jgi:hypothetical protein
MRRVGTVRLAGLLGVAACLLAAPAGARAEGQGYALLVAAADYDRKELQPLKYTQSDIVAFHQALLDAGFAADNIVLMHDRQPREYQPEGKKIRKQLDLLLARLKPADNLIVALSGHGVQFQGDKRSYFCPVDAELADRHTLLSLTDLYDELSKCRAQRKLLLVDACRNDPQAGLARSRPEVELESVTRPQLVEVPQGIVALFSCSAGQRSFEDPTLEHGIFFYHILQGWQGAADANGDGRLTLDELLNYTKDKTQAYAHLQLQAKQIPFQKGEFSGVWVLREVSRAAKADPTMKPGRQVQAEQNGAWWPAVIVEARAGKYLVHYNGWETSQDEWVPRERLRSELLVQWQGKWYAADIVELKQGKYRVRYAGTGEEEEGVAPERMHYETAKVGGQHVEVAWDNFWWQGAVVRTKGDRSLVHYIGWNASWDEWVTRDRLRAPAGANP